MGLRIHRSDSATTRRDCASVPSSSAGTILPSPFSSLPFRFSSTRALHDVDECAQRGRDLAATRIVEVKAGEAWAPVIEHAFERAAGKVWRHLRLPREADHLAGQHCELGDARVVLEQRAGHRDLALAATLLKLPPVRLATRPGMHHASVREQILWLSRAPVAREIAGRPDDHQALASTYLNGDHVAHDLLAKANACIEALRDDVYQTVVAYQLEHHVRVGGQEGPEPRRDDDLRGRLRGADANPASGLAVRPAMVSVTAASSSRKVGARRASSFSPAAVGPTLRVVR